MILKNNYNKTQILKKRIMIKLKRLKKIMYN